MALPHPQFLSGQIDLVPISQMRVSIKSHGQSSASCRTVISLVLPSLPANKEEESHGFSQLILTSRGNLFYPLPKEAAAGQCHLSLCVIRALAPLLASEMSIASRPGAGHTDYYASPSTFNPSSSFSWFLGSETLGPFCEQRTVTAGRKAR